ncbi:hypothetical protein FEM48_Zijuj01G0173000 [Ziziphus jujuba var. spinosa]|uniref:Translation initiation factor 5A C-terminal domain-containing protein n=1 Tax=Ziziphus jujuba var. spinosa TaxID=714518 RepID=A0A978W2J4_ZIZJJ|nr:hypothetical protein FEM48_Zijuj01G0173000 [Ziziphus jujuba var. spinosa]
MSEDEQHFKSKVDAGASKTFPQQAGTIRKNGFIVIKNRPCKLMIFLNSQFFHRGFYADFEALINGNRKLLIHMLLKFPLQKPASMDMQNASLWGLIYLMGRNLKVSLLTDSGNTKDDLRLPNDENLLTQIKDGLAEGKDLVVTVMTTMGEEQICAVKDIRPKNYIYMML